jgi:hypothetical protein
MVDSGMLNSLASCSDLIVDMPGVRDETFPDGVFQ